MYKWTYFTLLTTCFWTHFVGSYEATCSWMHFFSTPVAIVAFSRHLEGQTKNSISGVPDVSVATSLVRVRVWRLETRTWYPKANYFFEWMEMVKQFFHISHDLQSTQTDSLHHFNESGCFRQPGVLFYTPSSKFVKCHEAVLQGFRMFFMWQGGGDSHQWLYWKLSPRSFASKKDGKGSLGSPKKERKTWRFALCGSVFRLPDFLHPTTPQKVGVICETSTKHAALSINTGSFTQSPPFWEGPMVQNCSLADSSGIFRQGRQRRKALPDKSFVGFVKQKSSANRCGCSVTSPLFLWKRVVKSWTWFFQEKLGQFLMWRIYFFCIDGSNWVNFPNILQEMKRSYIFLILGL